LAGLGRGTARLTERIDATHRSLGLLGARYI
jgi:hypothetical protein